MSSLTGKARAAYVRKMFARISKRYDLLNQLITLGQDRRWRSEAVAYLDAPSDAWVLDVGAGTGDLSREALKQQPHATLIGADFTPEMIHLGRTRAKGERIHWVIADALDLPFAEETFHGVISGFLLRNVSDVDRVLKEQYRVLQPKGRFVCLDTSPPRNSLLKPLLDFHFRVVIPSLGRLIAGDEEAYQYLPSSTHHFLPAERLAAKISKAGFSSVQFLLRMFGTVAIHWAHKADSINT
jgi:demethylmenaquinone methyltransferase/2-methoxy-6-polyprenyl-1,4-benzoquinol methylase